MSESSVPEPLVGGFSTRDTDEACQLFSTAYAPVRVLPGTGGELDVKVAAWSLEGLTGYQMHCPTGVSFETELAFDGYNLTMPLQGHFASDGGSAKERSLQSRAGCATMTDGQRISYVGFSPELEFESLSISTEVMHEHVARHTGLPVRGRIEFGPHQALDSAVIQTVRGIADVMRTGLAGDAPLRSAPLALMHLRDALVSLLAQGLPHSHALPAPGAALGVAPRQVRRAIEFMHAHVARPLRLSDLATAAACSPRALQAAFEQFRSISPMEYLRQLRLQEAHAELLNPQGGATVKEVALRWGFAHMGQFSARYGRTFGELPSATLRRRRWP